jgi:hypothetical protein
VADNTDILTRRIKDLLVYFTATEIRQALAIYGNDDAAKRRRGRS